MRFVMIIKRLLFAGLMMTFGIATAQAEVVQAGMRYSAGAQLELPGSGATFSVPAGWRGQYNPKQKLFEMTLPAGGQVLVGYEGKRFDDAISYAQQAITTDDGVVMNPLPAQTRAFDNKFSGKAFAYSGKALMFMDVGAVAVVIKTPKDKGLTISAAGLGNDFKTFANQVAVVMRTLNFSSQPKQSHAQASGMNPAMMRGQSAASHTATASHGSGALSNSELNGAQELRSAAHSTASAKAAKSSQKHTISKPAKSQKASWEGKGKKPVKFGKGNPFKDFGTGKYPSFVDHSRSGLYLWTTVRATNSGYSDQLNIVTFEHGDTQVFFCAEDNKANQYKGHYSVKKKINGEWKYTEEGNYQLYSTKDPESWPNDLTDRPEDVMILDRLKGRAEAVKVKSLHFGNDRFWDTRVSFNGIEFSSVGIAEYCGSASYGGADREQRLTESSREQASRRSRSASSSSGSYDTHFGTTSSGAIIFSSPTVSGCSGC